MFAVHVLLFTFTRKRGQREFCLKSVMLSIHAMFWPRTAVTSRRDGAACAAAAGNSQALAPRAAGLKRGSHAGERSASPAHLTKRFGFRAVSLGCITEEHHNHHWYYDIHLHTTSSTVGISLDWHIEYCTGDSLRQQRSDPGERLLSDL